MWSISGHSIIISIIPGMYWNSCVVTCTLYFVCRIPFIIYFERGFCNAKIIHMSLEKFSSSSTSQHEPVLADTVLDYMGSCPTWRELVTVMYGLDCLQVNRISCTNISRTSDFVLSFQHTVLRFLQVPSCKVSNSKCVHVSVLSIR